MHNRSIVLVPAVLLLFSSSVLSMAWSLRPFARLNIYSNGELAKDYTCGQMSCPNGEHCEMFAVKCVRAPCPPVKRCVKTTGVTCANVRCAGRCIMHQSCDSSGCKDVPMCTARGPELPRMDDMSTDQGFDEAGGSQIEDRNGMSTNQGFDETAGSQVEDRDGVSTNQGFDETEGSQVEDRDDMSTNQGFDETAGSQVKYSDVMSTDQGFDERGGSKVEYRDDKSSKNKRPYNNNGWGAFLGGFGGNFGWGGNGYGYADNSGAYNSETGQYHDTYVDGYGGGYDDTYVDGYEGGYDY